MRFQTEECEEQLAHSDSACERSVATGRRRRRPHAQPQPGLYQCSFLRIKVTVACWHRQLSPVQEMLHLYLESTGLYSRMDHEREGGYEWLRAGIESREGIKNT